MTAKCVGCGLDWNVSIYQKIPCTVRAGSAPARPCRTFRPARRLGRRERKEQPHEKDRTQERRPRHGL